MTASCVATLSADGTEAAAGETYGSNTPASSARESRVLSTPNSTSPSGLPAVSAALLTTSPASPSLTSAMVMPVRAVKSVSSDFVSANESCVMSVTVVGANDDGTVLGCGAVPASVLEPPEERAGATGAPRRSDEHGDASR